MAAEPADNLHSTCIIWTTKCEHPSILHMDNCTNCTGPVWIDYE